MDQSINQLTTSSMAASNHQLPLHLVRLYNCCFLKVVYGFLNKLWVNEVSSKPFYDLYVWWIVSERLWK